MDIDINVNINDYELVRTNTINNIKIHVNQIVLFNSISICVRLFHDNTLIENKMLEISGTDYTNWGNDDNYIVNIVLTKLGLSKK